MVFLGSFLYTPAASWGFYAHKLIVEMAIFGVSPEMFGFFKENARELVDRSIQPDIRRHLDASEAPKHYIDLDSYGDSAYLWFPHRWDSALARYGEDTLLEAGILPWAITRSKNRLTIAMAAGEGHNILRHASDLAHYVSDAHVPLHTTLNYDGEETGQDGIHRFWESRIPPLISDQLIFWLDEPVYIPNVLEAVWGVVVDSHLKVDSVLRAEKRISSTMAPSQQYAFLEVGGVQRKVRSTAFVEAYEESLSGMVGRQMLSATKMVRDLWYTSWIDAGQPDLQRIGRVNGPLSSGSSDSTLVEVSVRSRIHYNEEK